MWLCLLSLTTAVVFFKDTVIFLLGATKPNFPKNSRVHRTLVVGRYSNGGCLRREERITQEKHRTNPPKKETLGVAASRCPCHMQRLSMTVDIGCLTLPATVVPSLWRRPSNHAPYTWCLASFFPSGNASQSNSSSNLRPPCFVRASSPPPHQSVSPPPQLPSTIPRLTVFYSSSAT